MGILLNYNCKTNRHIWLVETAKVAIPAPAIDPKVAAAITGKIGDLLLMSWLIEVELGISGRRLSKESWSSENSFSLALKWASMSLSRLLSSSRKSES